MWLSYVRLFGFELQMGYFARSSTVNISVEYRLWSLGVGFGFSYWCRSVWFVSKETM